MHASSVNGAGKRLEHGEGERKGGDKVVYAQSFTERDTSEDGITFVL